MGASEPSSPDLQIWQTNGRAKFLRAQAARSECEQPRTDASAAAGAHQAPRGTTSVLVCIGVTPFAQPWGWRALFLPGTERGANENAPLSSKPLPGRLERVMFLGALSAARCGRLGTPYFARFFPSTSNRTPGTTGTHPGQEAGPGVRAQPCPLGLSVRARDPVPPRLLCASSGGTRPQIPRVMAGVPQR